MVTYAFFLWENSVTGLAEISIVGSSIFQRQISALVNAVLAQCIYYTADFLNKECCRDWITEHLKWFKFTLLFKWFL